MNVRRLLTLLGLIGLMVLVISTFGQYGALLSALTHVRWYTVPLLIIMQLGSYWANAGLYQTFFRMSGHEVHFRRLFEVSLAINFANQVIPSGGVAGTTFLAESVHDQVPVGEAALSQLSRYAFTLLAYIIVLAAGFIWLFFGGNISRISVRLTVLVLLIILAAAGALIMVINQRRLVEAALKPVVRGINWLVGLFRHQRGPLLKPTQITQFLDEFYTTYQLLAHHRSYRLKLLAWSLAYNVFEVATVYVVFLGFGNWINPGVVIAGYTIANITSLAGVLTNGLGAYEAGMIGTFTALGQPLATAIAIVLVYRALSLILFLPPGAVYYRKYLRPPKS